MRTGLLVLFSISCIYSVEHDSLCDDEDSCPEPTHTVIRLAKRDDQLARKLASEHGMRVRGEPFLDSHYFLYHEDESHSRRRKRAAVQRLESHPAVEWLAEQRPKRRTKRDYIHHDQHFVEQEGYEPVKHSSLVKRRAVSGQSDSFLRRRQTVAEPREIPQLPFPDPLYQDQWYLVGRAVGNYDMNVREAWLMGYAGRNVSVSILDDGIQRDHPDLITNYDPLASTDINDHDDDPTPQNNGDNKHGTRCAGEVAAIAGNSYCGVGVAFKAKIGGVRMLDGAVSDSVEAASLSLNQHHIDIYSASWGPEDDGKTFDGPGPLAREAFYRGIKNGRNGKGNIFVWASGNGGSRQDSCSADGYTTSVYTLSISSATYDNHRPWYLEECPSSIATTYSSANINQPAIVTVDVPAGCTKMHTGTSASAPLAAGIIALALEANPALTWRDMQHIVLRTANPTPLLGNPGWSQNGVGRMISNKFGYGLMDGGALVRLAKTWKTVPEQHICTYEYKLAAPNPRPINGRFQMNFTLDVNGCESGTPVLYLEHVQVHATVRYSKRGDLKLTLFSPSNTRSVLLPPRPQDFNSNGFHKWPFLSVQQWGEDPRGTWVLMVESVTNNPSATGTFHDWTLLLYGTADPAQPGDRVHPPTPVPSQSMLGRIHQLTSQTEHSEPLSFGDLRSVGDCHVECEGGCSESKSAVACFRCKHFTQTLRNKAGNGFKCVAHCDDTYYLDGGNCKMCSPHCHSCTQAEICETCPGAQLLVDVLHSPQYGKCVDTCGESQVADYESNLVQARCVLRADRCGVGYYLNAVGKCDQCDGACSTCHGPGALGCDTCAKGYGNRSTGYCKPCCTTGQTSENYRCEDCSPNAKYPPRGHRASSLFWSFTWVFVVVVVVSFFVSVAYCFLKDDRSQIDYTPLPHYNSQTDEVHILGSESEDEEPVFDSKRLEI
ncbi:convertase P-domain protein [Necator americanus]|uniref:Convertase P-domain protein n=1 Tax=Necator americanus TaxID=51031 RepID=W2SPS9_NECAM|nr:convertase P-domain protein [Necator americanus]ETN70856.1 convertase P-domain protein [Necator americanus]